MESINIYFCKKVEISESFGQLNKLEKVDFTGTEISKLPSSMSQMRNLNLLDLRYTKGNYTTPNDIIDTPISKLEIDKSNVELNKSLNVE